MDQIDTDRQGVFFFVLLAGLQTYFIMANN